MNTTTSAVSAMMAELSAYLASVQQRRLPAEVIERAKIHFVDAIAAIISGSRLLPGQYAISFIRTQGGRREAGVMGTRIMTTAINAALVHGMCAHADETDDSHSPGMWHPGANVVPAALAIAERGGLDGASLLRAMVAGYDLGARMNLTLGAVQFFLRGHHPPSFGGLFGAAAAAGSLLALSPLQVRNMLSYTAQQAAGISCLLRDPEHVEKAFDMGGMTASNGTRAALFAAHGFSAVADVFSGERNFFATYNPQSDPNGLIRELGSTYEIMNASIKKWPVGAPILAAMDALDNLIKDHRFDSGEVMDLTVTLPEKEAAIVDGRAAPDISIQYLLAVALIDGRLTFEAAHDFARMREPKVVALKDRIRLVGSAAMTNPQRRWCGSIEIALRDGRVIEHYTHAAKGSSYNPLSRAEENEKARDLLAPIMGKARALALLKAAWKIDRIGDVRELRELYRV